MYYAPQKTKAGRYGTDTYSVSSPVSYRKDSESVPQGIQKRSSACCGRGCKPCVDDFKM